MSKSNPTPGSGKGRLELKPTSFEQKDGHIRAYVQVVLDERILYGENVRLDQPTDRARYAKEAADSYPNALAAADIERELEKLLQKLSPPQHRRTKAGTQPPLTNGRMTPSGEYLRLQVPEGGVVLARTHGTLPASVLQYPSLLAAIAQPISNFDAWIAEEIRLDDGDGKGSIEFEIEGADIYGDPLPPVRVSAADFGKGGWIARHWGVRATVLVGQQEHARVAIQRLSGRVPQRNVYGHTGWKTIDGTRYFLHADGALGATGPLKAVTVQLPDKLARYRLPDAWNPQAVRRLIDAVQVSDTKVTLPLLAAIVAAPLDPLVGPLPSIVLLGQSGWGKSTLIALFLHAFGGPFSAAEPVTTWEDTANFLEQLAHTAAQLPLWVDDIRPTTSRGERERRQEAIQRIMRGARTRSGRGRLGAGLRQAGTYGARCSTITSAEEMPEVPSTIARTLLVRSVRSDQSRLALLRKMQADAPQLFPEAGATWIRYLAGRFDALAGQMEEAVSRQRTGLIRRYPTLHLSIADGTARLMVGGSIFFDFAAEIGAIDAEAASSYKMRLREVLEAVALDTHEAAMRSRPSVSFLESLRSLLDSRQVVVHGIAKGRTFTPPEHAGHLGWKADESDGWTADASAAMIGWYDGNRGVIYLSATTAMAEVAKFMKGVTAGSPMDAEVVQRQLEASGLLARRSKQDRTITTKVDGKTWRVLALKAEAIIKKAEAQ